MGQDHSEHADIPVIILCGGLGTRLRQETESRPKPMVEIGTRPILWHIMKTYSFHGFRHFILCLGYKGNMIREYFLNYHAYNSDFTTRLGQPDDIVFHDGFDEREWRVTLAETGLHTMTGGRVGRVAQYVESDVFCLTYGDGVGDIDLTAAMEFHRSHDKMVTMTGVHPPGRFGELEVNGDEQVTDFNEKPQTTAGFINGGYMILDRAFLDQYVTTDEDLVLEQEPLRGVADDGQLMMYAHDGYWQPMDTYREYKLLNGLWSRDEAPWKVW
jgi:glucose-1-phosphate cytidylyltransferase